MLRMYWQIEKFDKNANLLESKSNISRSLLKAFLDIMYVSMARVALSPTSTLVDILSTSHDLYNSSMGENNFQLLQSDGASFVTNNANSNVYHNTLYQGKDCGILIGEDNSGVTATEVILGAQIAHGTGSGQMLYGGGVVHDAIVDGAYSYFDFERIFKNESGGSIIIKEIGISLFCGYYCYLCCRDALEEADWVTVADDEYIKVTYRLRVTS